MNEQMDNELTEDILNEYCGTASKKIQQAMMGKIFEEDCGCLNEYAADYAVDEAVADDIEYNANEGYTNTCDYTMITPVNNNKIAQNESAEDNDIVIHQGS